MAVRNAIRRTDTLGHDRLDSVEQTGVARGRRDQVEGGSVG
jgi:hypothetical protein